MPEVIEEVQPVAACPEAACGDAAKSRDECIKEKGEESCGDLIEAYKQCMTDLGLKI
jgi:hypothetical protein